MSVVQKILQYDNRCTYHVIQKVFNFESEAMHEIILGKLDMKKSLSLRFVLCRLTPEVIKKPKGGRCHD